MGEKIRNKLELILILESEIKIKILKKTQNIFQKHTSLYINKC